MKVDGTRISSAAGKAKLITPTMPECMRCGEPDHFKADCPGDFSPCEFPLCEGISGERSEHSTATCKTLHMTCTHCRLRGHGSAFCYGRTPEGLRKSVAIFEEWADRGLYTRLRWQFPAWGVFFFEDRRFWAKDRFLGRYTYERLLESDVRTVIGYANGSTHSLEGGSRRRQRSSDRSEGSSIVDAREMINQKRRRQE